jgi:hypothetical protein
VNEVLALPGCYAAWIGNCLTLEDGTDKLPRNGGNYQSTLGNITTERGSLGGSVTGGCGSIPDQS